jgi:hypothetical protein
MEKFQLVGPVGLLGRYTGSYSVFFSSIDFNKAERALFMNRQTAILTIMSLVFLFLSFSIDPPNGKTGAPGESTCVSCHTPQSQSLKGSVRIEGFPATITPNETYPLTVVNRDSIGSAVKGGFQLTVLGPLNTKAGELSSPSANSIIQSFSGRQYFEHHPSVAYPDSNVIRWTVLWKASNLPSSGLITCYVAGNICNGNVQSSGDKTVISHVSGEVVLAGNSEITSNEPLLYPNPGSSEIMVDFKNNTKPDGIAYFYDSTGSEVCRTTMNQGKIEVPTIPSGIYWLKLQSGTERYLERWIKI